MSLAACTTDSAPDGGGRESGGSAASGAGRSSGGADDGAGGIPTAGRGYGGTSEPYANVVAVAVAAEENAYTFSVSIESADIDCTQFADWWEVVAEESLVYWRILEHSHTDANGTSDPDAPGNTFTRDGGPIAIGSDQVVVVRAHMNDGGYHGVAMRGTASSGFSAAPEIGPEFAAELEEEPPQPGECRF